MNLLIRRKPISLIMASFIVVLNPATTVPMVLVDYGFPARVPFLVLVLKVRDYFMNVELLLPSIHASVLNQQKEEADF